jgi:fructose-specific phosphotransferase system IIC component
MIIVDIGFDTFLGIMGGYIAVSIAGRAAFAPGFIATAVASNPLTYLTYGVK